MEGYRIAKQDNRIYSMGLTGVDGGIHVCVAAQGEVCDLLLYRSGEQNMHGFISRRRESAEMSGT